MTRSNFDLPRHWTGEQALAVLEWLQALTDELWRAYDDELLQALDDRQFVVEQQLEFPF